MKYSYSFLQILVSILILTQTTDAQVINTSHQAVFYNFRVEKCSSPECRVPYSVQLESVKTVLGSFKGINKRITSHLESNEFLVRVYDKRTGAQVWETVMPNPVEVNVEYDAEATNPSHHEHPSGLQHKLIELEEGAMAVRLPYSPDECIIRISYIASPEEIIELATF